MDKSVLSMTIFNTYVSHYQMIDGIALSAEFSNHANGPVFCLTLSKMPSAIDAQGFCLGYGGPDAPCRQYGGPDAPCIQNGAPKKAKLVY